MFVGAGHLVFSGVDSKYSWCRFHGICWCRTRLGFFVGAEALVFSGADSTVFVGVCAVALVFSGADTMVFVGVGVGLASLLEQKPLCLLVQIPQYFFCVCWCRSPWVQTPCMAGADSMVFVGIGAKR